MTYFQAALLAIIEGITEFLPVSSTGHMIIASSFMGIAGDNYTKLFTIAIQLGAILSVVVLYYKKFIQSFNFYKKLVIAFIPAAVLGKLLNDFIDSLLENVVVVAFSLFLGGIVLLFVDKWFAKTEKTGHETPSDWSAFKIGLFQCIAMIPGVSRSAASIIGGLAQNLNRKAAAEFSFFLAVPTMFAATLYKLYSYFKTEPALNTEQLNLFFLGNLIAFVVAMLAIKGFIGFLNKRGFKVFGYYRIALGLLLLFVHYFVQPLMII
jgi:undecaprenyl-diphosphatase